MSGYATSGGMPRMTSYIAQQHKSKAPTPWQVAYGKLTQPIATPQKKATAQKATAQKATALSSPRTPPTPRYTAPKVRATAKWTPGAIPTVTARTADVPQGEFYRVDPSVGSVGTQTVSADAAAALLREAGADRVAAARESEIARGMGRSGVALGVEQVVGRQNAMDVAAAIENARNESARLQLEADVASAGNATNIETANQGAFADWADMIMRGGQFNAQLGSEYDFANQNAAINRENNTLDWSKFLGDLGFRVSDANSKNALTASGLNEQARGTNLDWAARLAQEARLASEFNRTLPATYASAGLDRSGSPLGGADGLTAYQQAQLAQDESARSAARNGEIAKLVNDPYATQATIGPTLQYAYGLSPNDPWYLAIMKSLPAG